MNTSIYVIAVIDTKVSLEEYFEKYGVPVVEQIRAHGGEVLVATKEIGYLEGNEHDGDYMVILRFPSKRSMNEWYKSEAYKPYIKLRQEKLSDKGTIVHLPEFDASTLTESH